MFETRRLTTPSLLPILIKSTNLEDPGLEDVSQATGRLDVGGLSIEMEKSEDDFENDTAPSWKKTDPPLPFSFRFLPHSNPPLSCAFAPTQALAPTTMGFGPATLPRCCRWCCWSGAPP